MADSNFVKVLGEHGFDVTYGHIDTGQDFLARNDLAQYDAIISNPPFSKKDDVFTKLFESGVPFAMICNLNGLFDSKVRWCLFSQNDFEILVPQGRMNFFNKNGIGKNPSFQAVWVCKGFCNKQIEFMNAGE